MQCVLVVDDDPHIREVVCFALEQAGYRTLIARDGVEALSQQKTHHADLIVLDILMPELDGLAVCKELREVSEVPIIMLSSRDEELDRVLGLEAGADDYVGKPFSPRELVARVKANLRRPADGNSRTLAESQTCDLFSLNRQSLRVTWNETPLDLTHTEFRLIQTLISEPDRVFQREELMARAYDRRRIVSHRTIDSHIRRLREKLAQVGAPGITTLHGVGFRLTRLSE